MNDNKTLDEWIEFYNRKAGGDKFHRDERYAMYYLPDKGFCEIGATQDMVIIHQLAGDARFWRDKASDLAQKLGYKMCGTWCVRKEIKAYIRLFGYEIMTTEDLADGLKRYICRHKKTEKHGLVSPAYKDGDIQAYFVTWEV